MATTPGGITYEELAGSPTFAGTRDGRTAKQRWKVAWSQIENLHAEIFPDHVAGPTGNVFQMPMTFPGKPYLYATNVRIEPLGGDDAAYEWDSVDRVNTYPTGEAIFEIDYSTMALELVGVGAGTGTTTGDTAIWTHDVSIGGMYEQLQQWSYYWSPLVAGAVDPDNRVQEEDVRARKFVPTVEHSLTVHYYPAQPLATILSKVGHVNSASDVFGHEAVGTMLYMGANISRTASWSGAGTYKLTHRFSERLVKHGTAEYGWNYFWKPSTSEWVLLYDADGKLVFPETTFAELFTALT